MPPENRRKEEEGGQKRKKERKSDGGAGWATAGTGAGTGAEGMERAEQPLSQRAEVRQRRVQLTETHRHRHQVARHRLVLRRVEEHELEQRRRLPTEIRARREQGALTGPPLREANQLAPAVEDLAGTSPGEAHQLAEPARRRPARVHVEAVAPESEPGQCLYPPSPDPLGRCGHVDPPHGVVPRYPCVQPELRPGLEIDGPSPTAATGKVHVPPAQGVPIDQLRRLRAAEHQRGPGHRTRQRDPPWLGAELLDVEGGWRRGQPQEAAARYGAHNGSTSERWRSRHRCPSGGAGFTRSVHPNSESN